MRPDLVSVIANVRMECRNGLDRLDRTMGRTPRAAGGRPAQRAAVRLFCAALEVLPARRGHRVLARPVRRKAGGLAAGVLHRGGGGAAVRGVGPARCEHGAAALVPGQPLGCAHRWSDLRRRHGHDPRLCQPPAGALGQREPARAALGPDLRGDGAGLAGRRAGALARGDRQPVGGGGRAGAQPAGAGRRGAERRPGVWRGVDGDGGFLCLPQWLGRLEMAGWHRHRAGGGAGLAVHLPGAGTFLRAGAGAGHDLQWSLGGVADARAQQPVRALELRPGPDAGRVPRFADRWRLEARRLRRWLHHAALHRRRHLHGLRVHAGRRLRGGRGHDRRRDLCGHGLAHPGGHVDRRWPGGPPAGPSPRGRAGRAALRRGPGAQSAGRGVRAAAATSPARPRPAAAPESRSPAPSPAWRHPARAPARRPTCTTAPAPRCC
jgi:hypothetical protein